jgi:hypothetical protein
MVDLFPQETSRDGEADAEVLGVLAASDARETVAS